MLKVSDVCTGVRVDTLAILPTNAVAPRIIQRYLGKISGRCSIGSTCTSKCRPWPTRRCAARRPAPHPPRCASGSWPRAPPGGTRFRQRQPAARAFARVGPLDAAANALWKWPSGAWPSLPGRMTGFSRSRAPSPTLRQRADPGQAHRRGRAVSITGQGVLEVKHAPRSGSSAIRRPARARDVQLPGL